MVWRCLICRPTAHGILLWNRLLREKKDSETYVLEILFAMHTFF